MELFLVFQFRSFLTPFVRCQLNLELCGRRLFEKQSCVNEKRETRFRLSAVALARLMLALVDAMRAKGKSVRR